jgi:regulator of sigma D
MVSGFTDVEGCFYFKLSKSIGASFELVQNTHDYFLLQSIREWLGSGHIYPRLTEISLEGGAAQKVKSVSKLYVNTVEGLNKIITHFDIYPLITSKALDFNDCKTLISMKNSNLHSTQEGLEKMLEIKGQMNKN